jgi:hypothetical protein
MPHFSASIPCVKSATLGIYHEISPLTGIIKGGLVYDSAATYRDKIWI